MVAPHVGAWIETALRLHLSVRGAWIETPTSGAARGILLSLPTWERGLKLVSLQPLLLLHSRSPRGSVD